MVSWDLGLGSWADNSSSLPPTDAVPILRLRDGPTDEVTARDVPSSHHSEEVSPPHQPTSTRMPALMSNPIRSPIVVHGDSNLRRCSKALGNTIAHKAQVKHTSGANFHTLDLEVKKLANCDIRMLTGGVNDAAMNVSPETKRRAFAKLLCTAREKSRKVIVVPPPPLTDSRISDRIVDITRMMRSECSRANVEFVELSLPINPSSPLYEDHRHVTPRGAGYYSLCILRHLATHHSYVNLKGPLCTICHQSNHKAQQCRSH